MLIDALQFLTSTLFDLIATAFFLRFWLQWARVPFRNPLAQFVVKVTDFAVKPLRRVIPGLLGVDWASVLPLLVTECLAMWISLLLAGEGVGTLFAPGILVLALTATLRLGLYVLMGCVIVQAVISWVNPYSPFAPVFQALTRPVLAPLQRFIPPVGGMDLSPMVALILIQLLLVAPVAALERLARGLL